MGQRKGVLGRGGEEGAGAVMWGVLLSWAQVRRCGAGMERTDSIVGSKREVTLVSGLMINW